jgi:holo-[acyl-carrier protein] synthase
MIRGIGVDTVIIRRIRDVLQRRGRAFALKVLTAEELDRFDRHPQPARYLAKRFAVKEAFSKAMGTGIHSPVTWRNIGTAHNSAGAPQLAFHPDLQSLMMARGITRSHVSVTDEEDLALAYVILEDG